MFPIGLLSTGEEAEIVEIRPHKGNGNFSPHTGERRNENCRIEDMGLRTGKVIEMLSNEGRGPILLKVDESRIAIGRGMAMKIMVKRVNSEYR